MNTIFLFIFDNMTDYEVTFVTHLLKADSNKEIITIAYEDKIIKSASGLLYKPNKLVKDVFNYDVDGLIICGAGTFFLASSGVLNDIKYTTPISSWTKNHSDIFGYIDPFPRENYILKRVVTDKNIIAAQEIAFIDFAITICD